jgi:hypothetical protein
MHCASIAANGMELSFPFSPVCRTTRTSKYEEENTNTASKLPINGRTVAAAEKMQRMKIFQNLKSPNQSKQMIQ